MPPPTPAVLYTDAASINGLLSQAAVDARLNDGRDGVVTPTEDSRLGWAAAIGTAAVNRYCQPRYEPTQLALSWSVWDWATVCAALWLCRRRGNPAPASLEKRHVAVQLELQEVRSGLAAIEDIPERMTDAPAWSNTTLDPLYRGRQVRVERRQSEQTPRERPPALDYPGEYLVEP